VLIAFHLAAKTALRQAINERNVPLMQRHSSTDPHPSG
jgi:hypothetical protein